MNNARSLAKIWGEAIRQARTELGLSVTELASRAGIDTGHLSRVERGLAGIGDEYRISIARELNRPVTELFAYPADQSPYKQCGRCRQIKAPTEFAQGSYRCLTCDTDQEPECPSAASAPAEAASRTPATTAAPRSAARSAKAPAASAPRANHGIEGNA